MTQSLRIQNIEDALKGRGWTQRKLAAAVEVSAQTVTNWLKGNDFPRPAALLKLSRVLSLSFDQLVGSPEAEPVIAFRRKAATKTTLAHVEKAVRMGYLLKPLVAHLTTLDDDQVVFRQVNTDYDVVERLAKSRREEMGLSQDAVLDYTRLISTFADNGAVLVPVLWGEKGRHENALHIHLPDHAVTFIYLNLDVRIEDFKFWMTHELAHVYTPTLCGLDEGEDFADAFAGALLFPSDLAQRVNQACEGRDSQGCLSMIKDAASKHEVSLLTAFKQVNAYRQRHGIEPLPLEEVLIHKVRNSATVETVRERIWGKDVPTPEQYLAATGQIFGAHFFNALKKMLNAGEGGPGYVQQVLDVSRADAIALHEKLTR
ncbi:MAG TPA: helix-turn-helix transcriptional regulator [Candidatus Competibacter sp.]|nr:helix-turn-helix transcriptional regulator [Candidatus Competibacter sp.]